MRWDRWAVCTWGIPWKCLCWVDLGLHCILRLSFQVTLLENLSYKWLLWCVWTALEVSKSSFETRNTGSCWIDPPRWLGTGKYYFCNVVPFVWRACILLCYNLLRTGVKAGANVRTDPFADAIFHQLFSANQYSIAGLVRSIRCLRGIVTLLLSNTCLR